MPRDGERIAGLGAGDFLGEMGIVRQLVRNASVVTTSPARGIVMAAPGVRSIAHGNPAIATRITAAVEERCRKLVG